MNSSNLFVVKNLSFAFSKEGKLLFKNSSLEIKSGAITFIRGKNGMGKSTLFKILQGDISEDAMLSAELTYQDKTYAIHGRQEIPTIFTSRIKMVQQSFDTMIAPEENFITNLALAKLGSIPTLSKLPEPKLFKKLITKFNIDMQVPVHLLSGGQRQILALCMALQKEPELLLLDEPTAALDEQNSKLLIEFLHALQTIASITILIITHDKEVIENYVHGTYYELEDQMIIKKDKI